MFFFVNVKWVYVFVICSYDFVRGFYFRIVGKVFIGIMCIFKSVFIVEDCFSFIILEIVVYEFGYR